MFFGVKYEICLNSILIDVYQHVVNSKKVPGDVLSERREEPKTCTKLGTNCFGHHRFEYQINIHSNTNFGTVCRAFPSCMYLLLATREAKQGKNQANKYYLQRIIFHEARMNVPCMRCRMNVPCERKGRKTEE